MEYAAVFHDTNKKYCYAVQKGKFAIRLKTKKDDIKQVILHYQDKYIPLDFADTRQQTVMSKIASDCWNDYFEAIIDIDMVCLRYFFQLVDSKNTISYYGNHEFFESEITSIDYMYDCPQNLREEEIFETPEWARNSVVYQIFPARFASSQKIAPSKWYKAPIGAKENLKGDLIGIIEHIDHLKELGVDVIYMTPIFSSSSTHKYDTIDYYMIDPSFGTKEDLKELVQKAHSLGMRVILDAVFNHSSQEFFAFKDIKEKEQASKYLDWYYIKDFPLKAKWGTKPNFKCFSYFGGMPKLNLQNEETAEYFINVGRYWVEECDIDGWRMDVGDEISHKFWRKFRKAMKAIKSDLLIIGEIWHHAEDFLDGEEWDTVMNYPFYFSTADLIAEEKITVSRFMGNMGYLQGNMHTRVVPLLWNLIDSHDTARFLHRCGENTEKLKLAVAFQMLLPGMPVIYYGDEYGMTGGHDPDCRRGMLWKEEYQNQDVYKWYRKLIQIRKEYPCITEGITTALECIDEEGFICITKELEGETIRVCIHAKEGELACEKYKGEIDLITNTQFSGILSSYGVVVLRESKKIFKCLKSVCIFLKVQSVPKWNKFDLYGINVGNIWMMNGSEIPNRCKICNSSLFELLHFLQQLNNLLA